MKGYVFLDLDNNLIIKNWDYINTENPGFFSTNSHLLTKYWKFDSKNERRLFIDMLSKFKDLRIRPEVIRDFLIAIDEYIPPSTPNTNKAK